MKNRLKNNHIEAHRRELIDEGMDYYSEK